MRIISRASLGEGAWSRQYRVHLLRDPRGPRRSGCVDILCGVLVCNDDRLTRLDTIGTDFYQLDTHVLREALEVLQREKKASIFGGADGSMGVKFLPS